jgi:hypothetical protein
MTRQGQKHESTLKFLEMVNRLCPWNASSLDRESLEYFCDKSFLTQSEVETIIIDELDLFVHHAGIWAGALQPTPAEYFLRLSPKQFLPEARVWRFWYRLQRILPLLSKLVKILAAAQAHSAAAERTGSLFTHDHTSNTDATSVQTAVIRQRAHYSKVVNPMQNMPLNDLAVLDPM